VNIWNQAYVIFRTKVVPESSTSTNGAMLQETLDAVKILRLKKKASISFKVSDGPVLDKLVEL
jgi:hypothetical protein